MDNKSQIVPTTFTDLEGIYHLFDQSVIYQEQHGYPAWRNYDKDAIVRDIENGNQYKVMQEGRIAMVFSVAYADAVIWRHRDKQDAVYLHRIVVNPACKGKRLFGNVLDWSIVHARSKGRKAVRMDTWAANPRIIEYYQGFGFGIVEHYTTPDTIDLPVHNRNLALTLLEYRVEPV